MIAVMQRTEAFCQEVPVDNHWGSASWFRWNGKSVNDHSAFARIVEVRSWQLEVVALEILEEPRTLPGRDPDGNWSTRPQPFHGRVIVVLSASYPECALSA